MKIHRALLLLFLLLALPARLPADEPTWQTRALSLMRGGEYEQAANLLLSLNEEADPFSLHILLGHAYLAQGLPLRARAEYDACLVLTEKKEQQAEALAGSAMVALLDEDVDHARRLADQAAALAGDNRVAQLALGFLALDENKPADALNLANNLLADDEHDAVALTLAAIARAQAAEPDQALALLDRLQQATGPDHPVFLAARYRVEKAQNKIDDALGTLATLAEKLPAHSRLAVEHARLLADRHRVDEAVRRLEAPLAASPDLPYLLRARAHIYLDAAIPGRAAEDLEKLVFKQKAVTNDFLLLAEAYRETRNHEHWLTVGRQLETQLPAAPDGPHLIGACLEDQGDSAGALQAYERALRRDPYFAPTLLARADFYVRENRLDEARRDIETLRQAHPEDERGKLLLASIELLQDHADVAEKLLREVLAQTPDDLEAQLLLALALERQGRHEEAAALQSALAAQEMTPLQMVHGLMLLRGTGQDEEIIKLAGAFLRDHPRDYGVRALLIDSLVNLRRYDEALVALDEQVNLWGMSRMTDLLRARCLGETGKMADALAILDQYLQKFPADLRALYLRGTLRQRNGDLDGALKDLLELARLDTEAAAPRLALARLFIDRHEFDRARAEAWLYERRTDHPEAALRLRGQVELAAGKYQDAMALLSQALEMQPNDVQALEMRAKAFEALGQADRAAADRRRIAELQAANP